MNAKEVCSIVKACATSGVSEIRLGELHVVFKSPAAKAIAVADQYTTLNTHSAPDDLRQLEFAEPELNRFHQQEREEDLLLVVENPEEWERRQLEDQDAEPRHSEAE